MAALAQLVAGHLEDKHSTRTIFALVTASRTVLFAIMINMFGAPALIISSLHDGRSGKFRSMMSGRQSRQKRMAEPALCSVQFRHVQRYVHYLAIDCLATEQSRHSNGRRRIGINSRPFP